MDSFFLQLPQVQLGLQLVQQLGKKLGSSKEKEKGEKAD